MAYLGTINYLQGMLRTSSQIGAMYDNDTFKPGVVADTSYNPPFIKEEGIIPSTISSTDYKGYKITCEANGVEDIANGWRAFNVDAHDIGYKVKSSESRYDTRLCVMLPTTIKKGTKVKFRFYFTQEMYNKRGANYGTTKFRGGGLRLLLRNSIANWSSSYNGAEWCPYFINLGSPNRFVYSDIITLKFDCRYFEIQGSSSDNGTYNTSVICANAIIVP